MSRPAPDPWPGSRTAWSLSLGGSDLCLTGELSPSPQPRTEADVSPFTPSASRTQAFCVWGGGVPDSLLLRARLPLSPGRGKKPRGRMYCFYPLVQRLGNSFTEKDKVLPSQSTLKGESGGSLASILWFFLPQNPSAGGF